MIILKKYMVFFLGLVFSGITLLIYFISYNGDLNFNCLQVFLSPIFLLFIPFLNKQGFKVPNFINYMILIHLVMTVNMGTCLNFYNIISFWDLIAHGYFGFLGSFIILIILFNLDKVNLNRVSLYVAILLSVLGMAALWEIIEFSVDQFFGLNTQKVTESIEKGLSPIYDTMMDIIITIVGFITFFLLFYIDKMLKNRLVNYLKKFFEM